MAQFQIPIHCPVCRQTYEGVGNPDCPRCGPGRPVPHHGSGPAMSAPSPDAEVIAEIEKRNAKDSSDWLGIIAQPIHRDRDTLLDIVKRQAAHIKEICTHQRTHGEAQGYAVCDDCGALMPDEMYNRGFQELQKQLNEFAPKAIERLTKERDEAVGLLGEVKQRYGTRANSILRRASQIIAKHQKGKG